MTDRRVLPHDLEAEKSLLGIAILEPKRIPDLIALVGPEDFYGDKNKEIFKAIVTLAADNKEATLASIYENMGGKVGAAEIGKLVDGIQAGADIYAYGRIVKEKGGLRRIIGAATKLAGAAYDGDIDDIPGLMAGLSANKLTGKREHALSEDVKKWISVTNGNFSITDCYNSLQGVTPKDRPNIRMALHRLKDEGIIEPAEKRDGIFRLVRRDCDEMDWKNAPDSPLPFKLPLGLNEIVNIYPKTLIVLAGEGSKGKTTFCLETIRLNMDKFICHYFSSELGESRLKRRLSMFEEMVLGAWKFKAYWRVSEFGDVIKPDDANFVDWLAYDDYYVAGNEIRKIFKKLNNGILIIALQKSPGKEFGRGGDATQDFASLYLTMSAGIAKILKAKDWKSNESPDGKTIHFKIENASKFITDGSGWQHPESREVVQTPAKTSYRRLF